MFLIYILVVKRTKMKQAVLVTEDQTMEALGSFINEYEDFKNVTLTQIKNLGDSEYLQSILIHKGMPIQAKENGLPAYIEIGNNEVIHLFLGLIRLQFLYDGKREVSVVAEELMMAICAIVFGE